MAPANKPSQSAVGSENPPSNNLWIGNIAPDVNDAELKVLFENHGKVDSITSYPSRNYAFLYFKDVDGAVSAKQSLQGHFLHGMPLKIEFAKPAKPCKSLWVAGISQSVPKEDLEKEFLRFGKIQEFRFLRDRCTAYVDYVRLEDATQALKSMNGKQIGGGQIRVDFLRSQTSRREQGPDAKEGQFFGRNMGPADFRWMPQDSLNHYSEPSLAGSKMPHFLSTQPSRVLLISHPPSVIVEEDMLHNAMILFGEIERIKTFPDMNYAFVEFRSVEEARRAKEGLQGKLFNDPRILIDFSSSEIPGMRGHAGEFPIPPVQMKVHGLNRPGIPVNNPLLPPALGIRGPDMFNRPHLGPTEFGDLPAGPKYQNPSPHMVSGGPNWRRSSPTAGIGSSPSAGFKRSVAGAWDVFGSSELPRDAKRSRCDGALPPDRAEHQGGFGEQYGVPLSSISGASGSVTRVTTERDCIWRGLITKGGTPVCRARCVPVGEGVDVDIPDVVDCSARTGLEMLTKHYEDAIGFSVVFFLPDSVEDFSSYTEFLRFLGSRNRAGVAKFDNGTTLFLVPPSDFLTKVLKVSGPERLYGVVLNFPQLVSSSMPMSLHPVHPQHADPNRMTSSQMGYSSIHQEEMPLNYSKGLHGDSVLLSKAQNLGTSSFAAQSVPQPVVSLTPELIATLTSLLPGQNTSGSQNVSLPQPHMLGPTSNVAAGPETNLPQWNHEHQTNYQGQQHVLQPQPQALPTVPSSTGHFYQPVNSYGQMYGRTTNLPPQGAVPLQSGTEMSHQYQQGDFNDVYGAQGIDHGTSEASRFYNPSIVQQPTYPVPSPNQVQVQVHGSGALQPQQSYMPQPAELVLTHQNEQLQNASYGVAQGGAETEADKNERYKTTLLFAADLLSRIHQTPGNQSGQGTGSH